MNYSVFKLQNQGGKPGIFWEKETVPKNDRKKKEQRFPIRRYPGDKHHVESDLVSLTPDEPPPPPKPAKNFIKRNRQKVTNKKELPSTVTLTQEQLNAILKSVGKVAGGSENAVKISIDKNNETKEITVESPRRYDRDDEDDYDDRKERRRKKKPARNDEEEGSSIYSLLEGKKATKASSKEKKTSVEDELQNEIDNYNREKNRRNKKDIDNDDNLREKKSSKSKSKSKQQTELEKEIEGIRKNRARLSELENEIEELRRKNQSKRYGDDDADSDYEKENRVGRGGRSKKHDSDNEDIDIRDYERSRPKKSERTRKEENSRSRERRGRKTRKESEEREERLGNDSLNTGNEGEELMPSPRDKIGLPIDLSWRHMTKAERRRLEMARQKQIDEDERKEEERIREMNTRYAPPEESHKPTMQRHKPPRSDPVSRLDRGRDTEVSNYTDNNKKGRRSRSPSEHRTPERSPDLPAYTTPDSSPKGPLGIPRRHMTLAEKKRLEWERDRVESVQLNQASKNDPWGRPGAGAPLRTRSGHVMADYKGRQVRKASYAGKVMMMY